MNDFLSAAALMITAVIGMLTNMAYVIAMQGTNALSWLALLVFGACMVYSIVLISK